MENEKWRKMENATTLNSQQIYVTLIAIVRIRYFCTSFLAFFMRVTLEPNRIITFLNEWTNVQTNCMANIETVAVHVDLCVYHLHFSKSSIQWTQWYGEMSSVISPLHYKKNSDGFFLTLPSIIYLLCDIFRNSIFSPFRINWFT